jgi:hypothetical protein
MDHHRPDRDYRSSPTGGRVEDDFVRPLTPIRGTSHRRLPAALPFAIAAIFVVSSVAFGATVIRNIVAPSPSASAVLVGDDNPTDEPTLEPTDAPTDAPVDGPVGAPTDAPTTAPTAGQLMINVQVLPGKAQVSWSAYTGADFAYYKVVRSSDGTAAWPLGGGDTLVAAIDNKATLTFLDCSGPGTFTYRVFAVTSSDSGYAVLASSDDKTVTVAPATTKAPSQPVTNPADLGVLHATDNGDGTYTFSWNAYTGGIAFSYYKLDGQPYPNTPGYVENGGHYWAYASASTTSTTIPVSPGTWNINVEAVYYPDGARAGAKTSVLKLTVAPHTAPPVLSLTLNYYLAGDNAHLYWNKYTGPNFKYYGLVRTEGSTQPVLTLGSTPQFYFDNVNTLFYADTTHLIPGHTYHYRVYAYTDQAFSSLVPACTVGTILAVSNVIDVTVPVPPSPTPTPTPVPTPTPTPVPTATPTATPGP